MAETFILLFMRKKIYKNIIVGGFYFFLIKGLIWLALIVAAALGIGNGVQVNSVSQVIESEFGISSFTVGIFIAYWLHL